MFGSFTPVDHVSVCAVIFSKHHFACYMNCLYTKLLLGCSVLWKQCIWVSHNRGPVLSSHSLLSVPGWSLALCFLLTGVFAHLPKVPAHPDSLCLLKGEDSFPSIRNSHGSCLALCPGHASPYGSPHGSSLHLGGIVLLICLQPCPNFLFIECGSMLFCSAWLVVSDSLTPQLALIA